MLHLLKRVMPKRQRPPETVPAPEITSDYLTPQSADELLGDTRRQALLSHIWAQTAVSKEVFDKLYQGPIRRYAELVQLLPASENHHHAYQGGMLDHGLEIVAYALSLRQSYLLPAGAPPEDQAAQADAWTAAVAYGALVHDIGKPAVDVDVELRDGKAWHAWHGPLTQPYRFRYRDGRDYRLHEAAAGLLYHRLLDADILDWLSQYAELWGNLLYLFAGHYDRAGAIGEIVAKADRYSTARNIGANPEKVLTAPVKSLQKHLVSGLRTLLQNELKLNQKGAAGWLTQEGLFLVSKAVSDKLRAHLLGQGFEGIPTKNSALFDELQSHGIIEANADGNAIHRATVVDGDWKQEFTFLKVKPALIWGDQEYPPLFNGELIPEAAESAGADAAAPALRPGSSAPLPTPQAAHFSSSPAAPEPVGGASTSADDYIGDVLGVLGLDQADTPVAASAEGVVPTSGPVPTSPSEHEQPAASRPKSKSPQPVETKPLPPADANLRETGAHFMDWLKTSLQKRSITYNETSAKVHVVDGTAFLVTPGIFQRYCSEHPEVGADADSWRRVQRAFEKLKLHRKRNDDLNIWSCSVVGPRKTGKTLKGYVLPIDTCFDSAPPDNPFISLEQ